jgi:hypothetical protein
MLPVDLLHLGWLCIDPGHHVLSLVAPLLSLAILHREDVEHAHTSLLPMNSISTHVH